MIPKVFYTCIFLLLSHLSVFSQDSQKLNFPFKNKSIKYSILLVSHGMPLTNNGYRIEIECTPSQRKLLKNIRADDWIILLDDSTTDWAANLALYEICGREASTYYSPIKTINDWLHLKKTEVKYWKKYLKTHSPRPSPQILR